MKDPIILEGVDGNHVVVEREEIFRAVPTKVETMHNLKSDQVTALMAFYSQLCKRAGLHGNDLFSVETIMEAYRGLTYEPRKRTGDTLKL